MDLPPDELLKRSAEWLGSPGIMGQVEALEDGGVRLTTALPDENADLDFALQSRDDGRGFVWVERSRTSVVLEVGLAPLEGGSTWVTVKMSLPDAYAWAEGRLTARLHEIVQELQRAVDSRPDAP